MWFRRDRMAPLDLRTGDTKGGRYTVALIRTGGVSLMDDRVDYVIVDARERDKFRESNVTVLHEFTHRIDASWYGNHGYSLSIFEP